MYIHKKVETVNNVHYNRLLPQDITVRGSKKKNKEYNSVRCYIPEKIDLDKVLEENPPPFKYEKDCFIYILHLITSIVAWKKNIHLKQSKGYTPIHKQTLVKRVHGYRAYFDYLVSMEIVEEGKSYIPGTRSKGLKFTSQYISPLKEVYITKYTLVKSIGISKEKKSKLIENEIPYLSKWFNDNLTIDINCVKRFLRNEYKQMMSLLHGKNYSKKIFGNKRTILRNAYNSKLYVAFKIHSKEFDLSLDKISGRFYSNITQLKKELKRYVRYNGEFIYSIDIVNSQPFFSLAVLDFEIFNRNNIIDVIGSINPNILYTYVNNNYNKIPFTSMLVKSIEDIQLKQDFINYKSSVLGGRFYEDMIDLLLANNYLHNIAPEKRRAVVKEMVFATFFSDPKANKTEYMPQIKIFRDTFPSVYKIFCLLKSDKHNTLAYLLQKIESHIVLNQTCKEIENKYPNIPLFTIHDSVNTTSDNVEIAKQYLEKSTLDFMGVCPKLETKIW